jgi:ribosomal protein L11 methyltransferase
LAEAKVWPALVLQASTVLTSADEDALAAFLDDYSPSAIQDLTVLPLPPGGLWDPTLPPPPEPPPALLHWRVFFATTHDRQRAASALAAEYPHLAVTSDDVPDDDWAARSQRSLTAIRAGRFIVAPPWDLPDHDGDATVIVIEPSRGFGTGHHQSTRLCLRALSAVDVAGRRVLDLGTGSGVLAMAAFVSGAHQVIGVDVDPDAIDSARASARLNPRVGQVHWLVADFRTPGWDALGGGPFDVVLANLTGGMLRASAARIRELVRRDGLLICSGFDADEWPEVEQALALERVDRIVEDQWVALTLRAAAAPSGGAHSSPR